jgi:isoamylase
VLSQGVPMILGGDELSHSQRGNNNTYCQDSELTWLDWDLNDKQKRFLSFVQKVVRIWWTQPVFQRRKFFKGRALRGSDVKDISFFVQSGKEMSDQDWTACSTKCIGVRLAGDFVDDETDKGEPIVGDTIMLLLNAHHETVQFVLPQTIEGQQWVRMLDTADDHASAETFDGAARYHLTERSLAVLRTAASTCATEHVQESSPAVRKEPNTQRPGRPPLD